MTSNAKSNLVIEATCIRRYTMVPSSPLQSMPYIYQRHRTMMVSLTPQPPLINCREYRVGLAFGA